TVIIQNGAQLVHRWLDWQLYKKRSPGQCLLAQWLSANYKKLLWESDVRLAASSSISQLLKSPSFSRTPPRKQTWRDYLKDQKKAGVGEKKKSPPCRHSAVKPAEITKPA
ncbi:hypothetical protein KUCAC02_033573, partial [Chaenocephalus aceratus]